MYSLLKLFDKKKKMVKYNLKLQHSQILGQEHNSGGLAWFAAT